MQGTSDGFLCAPSITPDLNGIGTLRCVRVDSAGLSQDFIDFCGNIRIRRETITPGTAK